MTAATDKRTRDYAKTITFIFLMNAAVFTFAFFFEVMRAMNGGQAFGDTQSASAAWAALWMSPVLILGLTGLLGLRAMSRAAKGVTLVEANARAIWMIGTGVMIAGSVEGLLLLLAAYFLPDLTDLGDKRNLFVIALLGFGNLIIFLGLNLQSAAEIKEDHDQIL